MKGFLTAAQLVLPDMPGIPGSHEKSQVAGDAHGMRKISHFIRFQHPRVKELAIISMALAALGVKGDLGKPQILGNFRGIVSNFGNGITALQEKIVAEVVTDIFRLAPYQSTSVAIGMWRIYHILWQGLSQVIYLSWEEQNETALAGGKFWCGVSPLAVSVVMYSVGNS
ncbi:hypothetical protein WISP_82877 [Willisornis vidua]|uniref:Uncharacterized protein n=1 Tax=Willisornis vidua TaxID=1566151 RepID=A0ABQ9D8J1_9PASS|nr:hypothetical protein WISP_82877 [Willisornis vidua]